MRPATVTLGCPSCGQSSQCAARKLSAIKRAPEHLSTLIYKNLASPVGPAHPGPSFGQMKQSGDMTMRVMVFVKATEDSEKGHFPQPWTSQMMAAMGKYNDELRRAG